MHLTPTGVFSEFTADMMEIVYELHVMCVCVFLRMTDRGSDLVLLRLLRRHAHSE